ncbi:MAG: class I SAM-dependent methyltransferase [Cyanobacteria bacterium HKST-UBA03]|nr:class I SAM-dependent methyltransferase [Cyanobacteria bacterium HKST-UBA03]
METKAFFESVVNEYDDFILQVVPTYPDLIWALFYYLPQDLNPKHVVDLGCGTGNITQAVHHTFPQARITCVDEASGMLNQTAKKVDPTHLNFVEAHFNDLMLPPERFGLVVSNLAVHHITDDEKQALVKKIYDWLAPGGVFAISDGFRAKDEALHQRELDLWGELVLDAGMDPKDWAEAEKHRKAHDLYANDRDFCQWCLEAGFASADMVFRKGVWGVIHARKA